MKYNVYSDSKFPIKAWTEGVSVEEAAKQQLLNIANMPFIHKHVAVMPDVHLGKGATVGSVIATKGAIIPAAVGVDIGCGMMAFRTTLTASDLPDNLFAIRSAIEAAVPHGRTNNGGVGDRGAWHNVPKHIHDSFIVNGLQERLDEIVEDHPILERAAKRSPRHLGTLGSGNHFIEICLDENQDVWIMLHSGSRGIGNAIGQYFIEKAKKEMEKYFIHLVDKDLAYLPTGTTDYNDYLIAVEWAQQFALANRIVMMDNVITVMKKHIKDFVITKDAVNCHHNYISKEHHFGENVLVTRKGAVSAKKDELGIIPGSMGAKSFIVRGKGNCDSFHSCSHGAGRKMSRTEAKNTFTLDDQIKATKDVECRKDVNVIDEIPGAYKDIDAVMKAQEDLVDIVFTLKQVICVKG